MSRLSKVEHAQQFYSIALGDSRCLSGCVLLFFNWKISAIQNRQLEVFVTDNCNAEPEPLHV
jgi:hypothetical protein